MKKKKIDKRKTCYIPAFQARRGKQHTCVTLAGNLFILTVQEKYVNNAVTVDDRRHCSQLEIILDMNIDKYVILFWRSKRSINVEVCPT